MTKRTYNKIEHAYRVMSKLPFYIKHMDEGKDHFFVIAAFYDDDSVEKCLRGREVTISIEKVHAFDLSLLQKLMWECEKLEAVMKT